MTQKRDSKNLHSHLAQGCIKLLSGSAVTITLNLLYNLGVARFLGPDGFGQATSVFTVLTLLSAITLSYQMVAAKLTAQQNTAHAGHGIQKSAWSTGLILAVLLLLFSRQIANYLHLPSVAPLLPLCIAVAFYVPLGARRGIIQGEHRFGLLSANMVLEGGVRLLGSLLLAWAGFGVPGVIAANAAAVALAYFGLRPAAQSGPGHRRAPGVLYREMMQATIFFAGQMLINNSDIVLVKHFFPPVTAGVYAVVAMVGRVVFALCQAVVNTMVPVVAGRRAEEQKNSGPLLISLVAVLILGAGMSFTLWILPATVWTSLFGAGFQAPGPHGIATLLALYSVTSVVYSMSAVLITFVMAYRIAAARWLQLGCSAAIILGIERYHASLSQVILVQLVLVSLLLLLVAIPVLREVRGNAPSEAVTHPPLRLIRQVTEDEVINEFLKSDYDKPQFKPWHAQHASLIYAPDLHAPEENARRRALFLRRHSALWTELPADTVWYEIALGEEDLTRVRAFPRAQWRKMARGNYAITRVAQRTSSAAQSRRLEEFLSRISSLRQIMQGSGPRFATVLLIGADDCGPLAVIDGNHRMVAAVLENRLGMLRFLCGLSPRMTRCCWYRTSPLTLAFYGRNLTRAFLRRSRAKLYRLLEVQTMNS